MKHRAYKHEDILKLKIDADGIKLLLELLDIDPTIHKIKNYRLGVEAVGDQYKWRLIGGMWCQITEEQMGADDV